eukprot:CAMPEP_0179303396 /NCGR_PEP_ID=MMETSP0797-20121207/48557_1 /TAXON_ID=47934 /ORGANISM="Dinophysis acuminata, Strain DAEP01" /LENGTH=372 /DNA_ID=CAMNT_0021012953 /DNA_START=38 /DNA_END=1154 /DNA_ORIENTATION=-
MPALVGAAPPVRVATTAGATAVPGASEELGSAQDAGGWGSSARHTHVRRELGLPALREGEVEPLLPGDPRDVLAVQRHERGVGGLELGELDVGDALLLQDADALHLAEGLEEAAEGLPVAELPRQLPDEEPPGVEALGHDDELVAGGGRHGRGPRALGRAVGAEAGDLAGPRGRLLRRALLQQRLQGALRRRVPHALRLALREHLHELLLLLLLLELLLLELLPLRGLRGAALRRRVLHAQGRRPARDRPVVEVVDGLQGGLGGGEADVAAALGAQHPALQELAARGAHGELHLVHEGPEVLVGALRREAAHEEPRLVAAAAAAAPVAGEEHLAREGGVQLHAARQAQALEDRRRQRRRRLGRRRPAAPAQP